MAVDHVRHDSMNAEFIVCVSVCVYGNTPSGWGYAQVKNNKPQTKLGTGAEI